MAKMITSFEDLEVWQLAQDWAVDIYRITKRFPDDERFGLTSQMRRVVSSVSANISEGFGRRSTNDKKHFYVMAYASALETRNFLHLSCRLGCVDAPTRDTLLTTGTSVQKLINAFIKGLK